MLTSWSVLLPLSLAANPELPSAERYRVDGWSWCDVHLLARAWSVDDAEARARLGTAILSGKQAEAHDALAAQRPTITADGFAACPYWEAGYSYEQAEALGDFWGVDVYEAKARIEDALIWHMEPKVDGILADLAARDGAARQAFDDSGYTPCDADLLAHAWGMSADEAKGILSTKTDPTSQKMFTKELRTARKTFAKDEDVCPYWTLGYDYEDAEALAGLWGVDTWDAKIRVSEAAKKGKLVKIEKLLTR